jgi:Zn finger protein HypA/HybF involved in hydrogenase expression
VKIYGDRPKELLNAMNNKRLVNIRVVFLKIGWLRRIVNSLLIFFLIKWNRVSCREMKNQKRQGIIMIGKIILNQLRFIFKILVEGSNVENKLVIIVSKNNYY